MDDGTLTPARRSFRVGKTAFVLAAVAAVAAVLVFRRVLESPGAPSRVATRPVVVALRDIAEGRAIDRTSVIVAQWPAGTVPAGSYRVVDSIVGRVAGIDIFKGEVVVPGRLVRER